MKISERNRRHLKEMGIRVENVEKQVDEILKAIQKNGFTIGESQIIVESLANDIEQAKYHSPMTLPVGIEARTDPQPDHQ